jgi:hypothetical protein
MLFQWMFTVGFFALMERKKKYLSLFELKISKLKKSHPFAVDVHSWFFRFDGKKEEIPEPV